MKSTRITLLSALIVFGSFMPVKASSDDEASAPLEILTNEPVRTAAIQVIGNWCSGWSNTKIGVAVGVFTGVGFAFGYAVYRILGGNEVALKAQEGINETLKQETTFKLSAQRDTKLAQDEAYIEDAHNFIAKLTNAPNDAEFMQKVIVSNNHRNRVEGFYTTCQCHNENLAQISDPELKEEAKRKRKLINLYQDKAQAIAELRVYQDEEDKNAEALMQARLDNSIRERYAEQLRLINEDIKKRSERDEETHKIHRTAIQEMENEVKTIKTTINGIHTWQQTSIKQIDRYMPSIAAASQNCANLKDALNNVATQEQLTHGMAALAKAFGHESILMKTLATIQETQKTQGTQLSMQNNKLDAQRIKLEELEKKINAMEQKIARLDAARSTAASMSNPHNWDARKSTTAPAANKVEDHEETVRPEDILDPIYEIND